MKPAGRVWPEALTVPAIDGQMQRFEEIGRTRSLDAGFLYA
jgi:hypothetical protein